MTFRVQPTHTQAPPAEEGALHTASSAAGLPAPSARKSANPTPALGSFKDRAVQKIAGRQLDVTVVLPGTGRSVNRPLRDSLPGTPAQAEPADPLLAEAQQLQQLADAMLASHSQTEVDLWQRPAASTVRKIATKVIPGLKPAPLQQIASGGAKAPAAAAPGRIAADAKELTALVEYRRLRLDTAVNKLGQAQQNLARVQQAIERAPANPASAHGQELAAGLQHSLTLAQQQLAHASADVASCSQRLRDVIQGTGLLHLSSQRQHEAQGARVNEFVEHRVADLRSRIGDLQGKVDDRKSVIAVELQSRTDEMRALMSLDADLIAAEAQEAQADQYLQNLRAQRAATPTSSNGEGEHAAVLTAEIASAEASRTEAQQAQAQIRQSLEHVDTRFAQLDAEVADLHAQLAQGEKQKRTAGKGLQALDQVAAALPPTGAADTSAADQAALDELSARFAAEQTEVTTAFGRSVPAALKQAVSDLCARAAANTSTAALPGPVVAEIITQALAGAAGDDPARAQQILRSLRSHAVTHWPQQALNTQHDAGTQDVIAFSRTLAALPRGTDLLQVLAKDTPPLADPAEAKLRGQSLRVFWNADEAQASEPSAAVKSWLQQAKTVAHAHVQQQPSTGLDDVDHAAYNAVRNGYLSNAPGTPYAQHDQRMKKATVEWVLRAVAARSAPDETTHAAQGSRARRLVPNLNKTPFGKSGLNRAYDVGESMGMHTPRQQVETAIDRRIQAVKQDLAALRNHAAASAPAAAMQDEISSAQALLDHLAGLKQSGKPLSALTLGTREAAALKTGVSETRHQQRLAQRAHADTPPRGVLTKAQPFELPPFYQTLCESDLSTYEVLNRVSERLRDAVPEAQRAPQADEVTDADLHAAVALLKRQTLSEKSDIVTFFKPFILHSQLRDKVRLGGGGTLGGGVPTLPFGSVSPIASPIFSAEVSRSDEAFVQLFMPVLGMEMSFGKARSRAAEATVGVAVGPELAPGVSVQGVFSTRVSGQKVQTQSTLMRFFRTRHKDDEMRANMLNALDSLVRWDVIDPQKGRRYNGPLEAVFARNPLVSISQIESTTTAGDLTAKLGVRLPGLRFNDGDNVNQTMGIEQAVYAKAERQIDRRTEHGGHVRVVGNVGDTAQQRAGVSSAFNFSPVGNSALHEGHGAVQREGLALQLGLNRDLAWALEKHEISPFTLDDKQDADLDRHYATADDMLAEIKGNRETWLMRCIETLEPDGNGERDNPDNRMRAAILLDQFEKTITKSGKDNNFSQYNVNYSMKGAAGAAIDGYRGVAELARRRGDTAGVQRAEAAIADIMLMRGTWRPLMLIVREKARDSRTVGWRNLVRWQKLSNVDGQRTAAQFPPP